jgi:hypothetical protein
MSDLLKQLIRKHLPVTTDQKVAAGYEAEPAGRLGCVPHTCHTPRCPAVNHGHSRTLARRLPGPLLSQLTR